MILASSVEIDQLMKQGHVLIALHASERADMEGHLIVMIHMCIESMPDCKSLLGCICITLASQQSADSAHAFAGSICHPSAILLHVELYVLLKFCF